MELAEVPDRFRRYRESSQGRATRAKWFKESERGQKRNLEQVYRLHYSYPQRSNAIGVIAYRLRVGKITKPGYCTLPKPINKFHLGAVVAWYHRGYELEAYGDVRWVCRRCLAYIQQGWLVSRINRWRRLMRFIRKLLKMVMGYATT